MRWPDGRFTIRSGIILIAAVAAALGVVQSGWLLRQSVKDRKLAQKHADQVIFDAEMERGYRSFAASAGELARSYAQQVVDEMQARRKAAKPAADIDPGILGTRSNRIAAAGLGEINLRLNSDLAIMNNHQAREALVNAALMARQIRYFRELQRKYEQAARTPWITVEPDPPVPQ